MSPEHSSVDTGDFSSSVKKWTFLNWQYLLPHLVISQITYFSPYELPREISITCSFNLIETKMINIPFFEVPSLSLSIVAFTMVSELWCFSTCAIYDKMRKRAINII